jgi:hypothetical protein
MSLDSSGAESSKLNNPQSGQTNLDQSGASNMATAGSNGGLSKDEATRYIANFAMVDKNSDGQISQTEFQDGCEKGWVQAGTSSGQPGSPSGSSSESGG